MTDPKIPVSHREARALLAVWAFREPTVAEMQRLGRYMDQQEATAVEPSGNQEIAVRRYAALVVACSSAGSMHCFCGCHISFVGDPTTDEAEAMKGACVQSLTRRLTEHKDLPARVELAEQREKEARRTAEQWRHESNDNLEALERVRGERERFRRERDEALAARDAARMGLRPAVVWFAGLMEEKLRQNESKGTWEDCNPGYLWDRLADEKKELGKELNKSADRSREKIGYEAADVANIAMMIADVCQISRRNAAWYAPTEEPVPADEASPSTDEELAEVLINSLAFYDDRSLPGFTDDRDKIVDLLRRVRAEGVEKAAEVLRRVQRAVDTASGQGDAVLMRRLSDEGIAEALALLEAP